MRIVLALVLALATAAPALAQAPVREITRIAGEVYRFRNNHHYSVFAVTPAGVIATDPIDAGAARWLKEEIRRRFNQPVRYLIYSHDHRDHIAGGEVFADTALVVAHERTREMILGERRPTAVPQVTFSDRLTIALGGTVVELAYVGRNHSDNSIVMRFPRERLLFAVDFIPVEALPYRDLPDAWIPDWFDSLRRVEQMDFDILVPGHGPLGRKAHVRLFREYLEALHAEVLRHARAGWSLEEAKMLVTLPEYAHWAGYVDVLPLNVEGMYRRIQLHRRDN